jgi:hypothetical protein
MATTNIRGAQILNNTVQRQDLDTSTVGQAVVTKLLQGSGITLSSTGADSGTGDVTVSGAPVSSPVVLGETATDPIFTSGIIVPSYANHPDAIWTPYGAFDDHFDNPSSGTPNAKWVHTLDAGVAQSTYTQAASKLCLGLTSPTADATIYKNNVIQQLPVQATHQISFKLKLAVIPISYTATTYGLVIFGLEYGASAGGYWLVLQYLQNNNVPAASITSYCGAGFGTGTNICVPLSLAEYWQIIYDSSKNTTVQFSLDGVTWVPYISLTGAQTGFSTNAPSQFKIEARTMYLGIAIAQIDWIKHV